MTSWKPFRGSLAEPDSHMKNGRVWLRETISGGAGEKGAEVAKTSLQDCCHYCFGDANHEKQIVGDKVGFSAPGDGE